jgi:hypothetical protein
MSRPPTLVGVGSCPRCALSANVPPNGVSFREKHA